MQKDDEAECSRRRTNQAYSVRKRYFRRLTRFNRNRGVCCTRCVGGLLAIEIWSCETLTQYGSNVPIDMPTSTGYGSVGRTAGLRHICTVAVNVRHPCVPNRSDIQQLPCTLSSLRCYLKWIIQGTYQLGRVCRTITKRM